jgi:hypothetical protein
MFALRITFSAISHFFMNPETVAVSINVQETVMRNNLQQ